MGLPRAESLLVAGAATAASTLLLYLGPPGTDLAAHVYQRTLFLQHGLSLWNNFWYAGRYSFVTYSVIYYPLAAWLGLKVLAVSAVTGAAVGFSAVAWRQWGSAARWSSRAFALAWALTLISAMFPFALGAAFALFAVQAAQHSKLRRLALLSMLTLAASPVAFVLLVVVLGAAGIARRTDRRFIVRGALVLGSLSFVELILWRLFPSSGRYPYAPAELAASLVFCAIGTGLTWHNDRARPLRYLFPAYAAACLAAFAVPSALGENIDRLRYLAVPLAILVLSLRRWRPRSISVLTLVLAAMWNLSPLAAAFAQARADPSSQAWYWAPAVKYLKSHLSPDYRVEAVDTVAHWDAVYLPDAGIPLARGWFRQDDFPQNAVLYGRLAPQAYMDWLRSLGIAYVVLTKAPPDYSAVAEARLIETGRLPLRRVLATPRVSVYAVPSPQPLITGPGRPRIVRLTDNEVTVAVTGAGRYRIAVHGSPYWRASSGCAWSGHDGMLRLDTARAGTIRLTFAVTASGALNALTGGTSPDCT